ncbi:MAG: hypothetical protein ACI30N_08205 [Muribaculaceae bacterium]
MTKNLLSHRIATVLIAVSAIFTLSASKPSVILDNDGNGLYGFRAGYKGDWLSPKIYLAQGHCYPVRGMLIVQRDSDKKFNVFNDNFVPVLPQWVLEKPSVCPPYVISRVGNHDELYDFNGKYKGSAWKITPLSINANESKTDLTPLYNVTTVDKDNERGYILVGFSVALADTVNRRYVYAFLRPELQFSEHPLQSVEPIRFQNGLLQFYDGEKTCITDVNENILDTFDGKAKLTWVTSENTKKPLDNLYSVPQSFALTYNSEFNGIATGRLLGKEIFSASKFKDLFFCDGKNKKKEITGFFSDPAVVEEYNRKIIMPLKARLDSAIALEVALRTMSNTAKPVSGPDGIFFSLDGKTPVDDTYRYDSVIALGDSVAYIGCHGMFADLISSNGRRTNKSEDFSEIVPIDKNHKYFKAVCSKYPKIKLLNIDGKNIGGDLYDDVIYAPGAVGDLFYFVRDGKWRAWAPEYRKGNPIMPFYEYVGPVDANGVVEVKYKGFPGSYNLKSDKETSPVEVLFNKAYYGSSLPNAERVRIYNQVLILDEELNTGWRGAALNNLGTLYENAGNEDMAFHYFELSKNAGNDTGKSNYNRIRNSRRLETISKVAGAMSNAIGNTMAATGNGPADFSGYNSGYGDYSSLSSSSSASGSGYSASFYQEQYTNWERRARQAYESLTLLGSRTKRGGLETSGSTGKGMSSSNFTRQKRCLRDAQHEMQSIRAKAMKDGVTIQQSHWESVTVSY